MCYRDAKSLEHTLNRDACQPTDKRVRILVSQIKEMIGENNHKDDTDAFAIWTDSWQMLADVLTTLGCERDSHLHAWECGQWQLEPSEQAKLRKVEIRANRPHNLLSTSSSSRRYFQMSSCSAQGALFGSKQLPFRFFKTLLESTHCVGPTVV